MSATDNASFANATVAINIPCTLCNGTGVIEVGPEGTMKTKTFCSLCDGRQVVALQVSIAQLGALIVESMRQAEAAAIATSSTAAASDPEPAA